MILSWSWSSSPVDRTDNWRESCKMDRLPTTTTTTTIELCCDKQIKPNEQTCNCVLICIPVFGSVGGKNLHYNCCLTFCARRRRFHSDWFRLQLELDDDQLVSRAQRCPARTQEKMQATIYCYCPLEPSIKPERTRIDKSINQQMLLLLLPCLLRNINYERSFGWRILTLEREFCTLALKF